MSTLYTRAQTIVERKVRNEHLLVPLHGQSGRLDSLYTLNETAAFVWNALNGTLSDAQIAEQLTEEYDVDFSTALADIQHVLKELLDIQAIVPVPSQPTP